MSDGWREKAGVLREKAGGLREKAGTWKDESGGSDGWREKAGGLAGGLRGKAESWKDERGGWRNVIEKGGSSLKNQVKSQVNGFSGRGEIAPEPEAHVVTPRSALRDPSSFGPPPRHVAAYGPRPATAQGSSHAVVPVAGRTSQHVEEEPYAEPKPYRSDTTGLSTLHLPPPPSRHNTADGRITQSPSTYSPVPTPTPTARAVPTANPTAPPSLPPRLPPRSGNSTPSPTLASGLVASYGHLNQGAISRLGAAGISVPELGIGGRRAPPPPPGARPSSSLTGSPTHPPGYGQVDELQARFARMGAPPSPKVGGGGMPVEGTQPRPMGQIPSVLGKKKPPPPPIPKKPALSGTRQNADAPPPIPLATRPRFD